MQWDWDAPETSCPSGPTAETSSTCPIRPLSALRAAQPLSGPLSALRSTVEGVGSRGVGHPRAESLHALRGGTGRMTDARGPRFAAGHVGRRAGSAPVALDGVEWFI